MKKRYDHRPIWVREKTKPTYSESQPQLERLRSLSQWLLIIPVVMLVLFSCGQIGILTSRKIAEANTRSNMAADYEPWSYVLIHSVKPEIIDGILQDKLNQEGEDDTIPQKNESEKPWLNGSPKPTSMAYLEPTSTSIPHEDNQPIPTETQIPQVTPTHAPQFTTTPIPTQTEPTITSSPIPTSTSNPTNPPPDSPTNTPVSTVSNIYWFSNDRVLNGYVLASNQPGGPSIEENGYLKFYTDPMPEGAKIKDGKCTLTFYASNTTSNNMEIGIVVSVGSSGWSTLGGATKKIPANTSTPTVFTKTFSILPYTFSQGERLNLSLSLSPFVTMYWDGEWNDAGLSVPPITP